MFIINWYLNKQNLNLIYDILKIRVKSLKTWNCVLWVPLINVSRRQADFFYTQGQLEKRLLNYKCIFAILWVLSSHRDYMIRFQTQKRELLPVFVKQLKCSGFLIYVALNVAFMVSRMTFFTC